MQKLDYQIEIKATPSSVWRVLTEPGYYRQWVKAFSPNSYSEGEWLQGARMKFLDPDMGGTKAVLDIVQPEKRILARHVSVISKEGVEDTEGEMASKWIGTTEDYRLQRLDSDVTRLYIQIKTQPDFVPMFEAAWPEAISTIKALCEQ